MSGFCPDDVRSAPQAAVAFVARQLFNPVRYAPPHLGSEQRSG